MKCLITLALLAFLLVPSVASAQSTAGPLDSLRWDYVQVDLTTYSVTRFLVCYDTAAPPTSPTVCSAILPTANFTPTAAQGGPPNAGSLAYKAVLPAFTVGSHTASVYACNGAGTAASPQVCGTPMALTFNFVITPPPPTNGQIIKG
jgi:hypothetical protein